MRYPLSKFHWDKEDDSLIGYASDLRIPPGKSPWGRLFDDACDVGIEIVSDKTGRVIPFVLDGCKNELWTYRPLPSEKSPICEVTIFND